MTDVNFRLADLQAIGSEPLPTIRRPIVAALTVLGLVFGIGGYWAATAPLGGSLVSTGRIVAEGRNIVVQNLEGGILASLPVQEGQEVQQSDVLATLDTTAAQSQLERTSVQRAINLIELQRWRAQRDNLSTFKPDLSEIQDVADHPRIREATDSQLAEFHSANEAFNQSLRVIDGRISNEEEDKSYLTAQLKETEKQIALIGDEAEGMRSLLKKGLVPSARVMSLDRELSKLEAQISNVQAAIRKSDNNITSYTEEKAKLVSERAVEVNERLTALQKSMNENQDVINRLEDVIRRAKITSPVNGTVVNIPVKSLGAVVPPGQTIVELLPQDVALEAEVPIPPRDISKVVVGQEAELVFPTDQVTVTSPLAGTVSYVSSDVLVHPETGVSYYLARVALAEDWNGRTILPGNVTEVFFKTEARTLFELVSEPITRFAWRTFTD